ncbi:MAG: DAHL domain-containing protein [Cyanobacteria bacterium P01_G01_bin.54]
MTRQVWVQRWHPLAPVFAWLQHQPFWVPSRRLRVSSYLGVMVVLAYLSSQQIQIDAAAHSQYQRLLIAQKGLDAQLSEAILITRYQAQSSYDPALKSLHDLEENLQKLQQIPGFIRPLGEAEFQHHLAQKQAALEQINQQVERFKTQNAILKNSLIYLPTLKARLVQKLSPEAAQLLINDLDQLTSQLNLYSQTLEPRAKRDAIAAITRLQASQNQTQIDIPDSLLDLLLEHGQIILTYQPQVEALSQELIALTNTGSSEELEQTYQHYYDLALELASFNRAAIYSVVLLAILWTTYWMVASMGRLNRQSHQANQKLQATLAQLRQTQSQLIHSEKLSGLGQLVAGVAHEINNPVSFIYGNLDPAEQYSQDLLRLLHQYQQDYPEGSAAIETLADEIDLEFIEDDFPQVIASMRQGAGRIKRIVLGLRSFSRLDETGNKTVNLHEGIDSTLMLLQSQLQGSTGRSQITVIRNYGPLPLVTCDPGQLNQVFLNLLSNAIEVIHARNRTIPVERPLPQSQIMITTQRYPHDSERVQVKITDTGPGISQDIQQQIFDPFFTTKKIGQGTGLGLSSSYDIVVKQHQGQLICESKVGEGATFIIELPIQNFHPN